MYTRQWDPAFVDIHIGKDVITRMKQGEIAVLGHELEHVSQGILQAWSIQGEVMAYQVEYSIRDAMGIGQSRNTQASMEEAPSVQPKRVYDPYSLSDLLHARNEGFLNTKTYNRPWEPTLPWHIEILTEALQVIPSWVKWNQIQASRPY